MSSSNAHHPTAWYSEMTSREKTTFWACIGGWILDAMDVQMLSFAIPAIIAVFSITNADAGLIGTATLLSSAFGGWVAGALSDRFGRVRTLRSRLRGLPALRSYAGLRKAMRNSLYFAL
jgi:MFS family permease